MGSRGVKSIRFSILGFVLLSFIIGCGGGSGNPIAPQTEFEKSGPGTLDSLPIIAFDGYSSITLMGGFNLTISDDGRSADLIPMRSSAFGESGIVSGEAFFVMMPCTDCLRIKNIALDVNENIILGFEIKHPFQKGNTSEEPSAKNRLDLDIFDLAMVVKPLNRFTEYYSLTGAYVFQDVVRNADGYTRELSGVLGGNSALPYKICYGNANNNRFEMGMDYVPFDVVFSPGENLAFDLYITMGYGISTRNFTERLNPTYFVPEFNRKPAWKVDIDPVSWTTNEASTVTIDIYDWNHNATVASQYPDPEHTGQIAAESNIDSVTVEVPGMTNSIIIASTTDTSTNGWDDPITYTATFNNERGLEEGVHVGLVKVKDSRTPQSVPLSGYLIHTGDGGPDYEYYSIPEFATYQTFIATVVAEGVYHTDEFELYNDPNYPDVTIPVAKRQLVIYYRDGEYSHVMDLVNYSGSYLVGQILSMNLIQVVLGDGISMDYARRVCENDPAIISARPNCLLKSDIYPDGEPDFGLPELSARRWHFDMVKAPDAWELLDDGDYSVKVGIVDSGLDTNNFDGLDFSYESSDLPDITDYLGHGTHVAGILAASGDNHNGTLGMAWNSTVYPFNLNSDNPNGFSLDEITAVKTLVDRGCRVINVSMSVPLQLDINGDGDYTDTGEYYVPKDERAEWSAEYKRFANMIEFDYCKNHGAMLIKSAGDDYNIADPSEPGEDGHFQDDIPVGHHDGSTWITDYTPAQFATFYPNVLFVSATDQDDNYCDFSNRGLVDRISAPGYRIFSSYSTDAPNPQTGFEIEDSGQSAFASGTSMAAPMVSGLAALMLTKNPYLSANEISSILLANADPGPDADTVRLNAYNAVQESIIYVPANGQFLGIIHAGGDHYENDGSGDSIGGGGLRSFSDGSAIVSGMIRGTVTFARGTPCETDLTTVGDHDFFYARYMTNGTLVWVRQVYGPDSTKDRTGCAGNAILSDDSFVNTGTFDDSITFGPGESRETTLTFNGYCDIYIARFNQDGSLKWARQDGGESEDKGVGITSLSNDVIVASGKAGDSCVFGRGEVNETVLPNKCLYIAWYNPDGTLIRVHGIEHAGGGNLRTLSDDSVIITGGFSDDAIFGAGEINETTLTSPSGCGMFVAKYHPDGTLVWAKAVPCAYGGDSGAGIAVLPDGSFGMTGQFTVSATFGPGETNETTVYSGGGFGVAFARYNPDGTLAWARSAVSSDLYHSASAIIALNDGSLVATGVFEGVTTFGSGEMNETDLVPAGGRDAYLVRYYPDGTLAWAKGIGGSGDDGGSSLLTLPDNTVLLAGGYQRDVIFGEGEVNETHMSTNGQNEFYLARFAP